VDIDRTCVVALAAVREGGCSSGIAWAVWPKYLSDHEGPIPGLHGGQLSRLARGDWFPWPVRGSPFLQKGPKGAGFPSGPGEPAFRADPGGAGFPARLGGIGIRSRSGEVGDRQPGAFETAPTRAGFVRLLRRETRPAPATTKRFQMSGREDRQRDVTHGKK
jgi:hypothetical protein